ncbi:MAG: tetratricopeptide repeat protein, partial [Acidobacteriota bacterium]
MSQKYSFNLRWLGVAIVGMLVGCPNADAGPEDLPKSFKNAEAKVRFAKGVELSNQSEWNAAILEFNRSLALEPDHAAVLVELGISLGQLGRWEASARTLRKALLLAPDSARAHYNLGVSLDRAEPHTGAGRTEYEKALELDPNDVGSLVNLATSLGKRDTDQARELLEKALALSPQTANVHFNLGLHDERAGNIEKALQSFRNAIRLDPDHLEARRRLLSNLMAVQRLDEAIEQCREMIKRNPDEWEGRYTLARLLRRKGKREEANKELETVQRLQRSEKALKETENLTRRGVTDLVAGRIDSAVKNLKAAVESDSQSIEARMHLGMALAAREEFRDAV